jgi:hypothetical protein
MLDPDTLDKAVIVIDEMTDIGGDGEASLLMPLV